MNKIHAISIGSLVSLLFASTAVSAAILKAEAPTCKNLVQYTQVRGGTHFTNGLSYNKQGGKDIQSSILSREGGLSLTNTFLSKQGGSLDLGIFPKGTQILLCTLKFQCSCESEFCTQSLEVVEYNCNLTTGNGSRSDPYVVELGAVGDKK